MTTVRTTVTLDDDVAAAVQRVAGDHGLSFRAVLNVRPSSEIVPVAVRTWRRRADVADLADGPADWARADDRDLVDSTKSGR